jgi:hypothetical protein
MSHEKSPDFEANISTKGLVDYAERCFGAKVDIANFKYPSVFLLKDLEPLIIRYPAGYMDNIDVVDPANPIQTVLALVVESGSTAYAVIKTSSITDNTLGSDEDNFEIVKIQGSQQPGVVAKAESLVSLRIENGALIVRPLGNYEELYVYTSPKPDTQTNDKKQHHIVARYKSEESKIHSINRHYYSVTDDMNESILKVGAASQTEAVINARVLGDYGLWIDPQQ